MLMASARCERASRASEGLKRMEVKSERETAVRPRRKTKGGAPYQGAVAILRKSICWLACLLACWLAGLLARWLAGLLACWLAGLSIR